MSAHDITTVSDAFSHCLDVLQLCCLAVLLVFLGRELLDFARAIRSRWGGSNSHGFTGDRASGDLTDSDDQS